MGEGSGQARAGAFWQRTQRRSSSRTRRVLSSNTLMSKGRSAAAPIAVRVVVECRRVLVCARRRARVRSADAPGRRHRRRPAQQVCMAADLGVAEHVVLQVGETPVRLAELRIESEAILVGLLRTRGGCRASCADGRSRAAGAPPSGFRRAASSNATSASAWRINRVYIAEQHPVLRIFGLDLQTGGEPPPRPRESVRDRPAPGRAPAR